MTTLTRSAKARALGTLASLALLAMAPTAQAKPHPATTTCRTPISEFYHHGSALSYERVARSPAATRVASTGSVYAMFLLPTGREAIYEVTRDGCARRTGLARTLR